MSSSLRYDDGFWQKGKWVQPLGFRNASEDVGFGNLNLNVTETTFCFIMEYKGKKYYSKEFTINLNIFHNMFPTIPKRYCLPKIHKPGKSMRSIVSANI